MAIQLSVTNVFRFISYITPILLVFFMIMISVFNQDVKGLIYLGGVLIAIFITIGTKNMIKVPANNPAYTCELFDFFFGMFVYVVFTILKFNLIFRY